MKNISPQTFRTVPQSALIGGASRTVAPLLYPPPPVRRLAVLAVPFALVGLINLLVGILRAGQFFHWSRDFGVLEGIHEILTLVSDILAVFVLGGMIAAAKRTFRTPAHSRLLSFTAWTWLIIVVLRHIDLTAMSVATANGWIFPARFTLTGEHLTNQLINLRDALNHIGRSLIVTGTVPLLLILALRAARSTEATPIHRRIAQLVMFIAAASALLHIRDLRAFHDVPAALSKRNSPEFYEAALWIPAAGALQFLADLLLILSCVALLRATLRARLFLVVAVAIPIIAALLTSFQQPLLIILNLLSPWPYRHWNNLAEPLALAVLDATTACILPIAIWFLLDPPSVALRDRGALL